MKDKVLVRVSMPMADMAYDIRIPYDLKCATVTEMIAEMFKNLNRGNLPIGNTPLLWFTREDCVLDDTKTLREYGITDSDMLLLI